jgi:hypothetical protein
MKEQMNLNFEKIQGSEIFSDLAPHIVRAFWKYHEENPHIFVLFRRFALEARAAKKNHFSVYAITERIRWYLSVETQGDEFKINNNYRSCYARLLITSDPIFDGFFSLRSTPGTVTYGARNNEEGRAVC